MPIRKDLRQFYRTPEYRAQRERVRKRASDKCEQCGKPNHLLVWVYRGCFGQYWTALRGRGQHWHYCIAGGVTGNFALFGDQWKAARRIRVVLTMAHLNHDPSDNSDENTKFLCQWCHLNYDKLHHKETRSRRKDAGRPLLQESANA